MAQPPTDRSLRPVTRWFDGLGCLLPFVAAPVGLAIGWWAGGVWLGITCASVVALACLWVVERRSGSHAVVEIGCALTLYLMVIGFLATAVPKIRQAADRIKAERQAQQNAPPAPADGEKQ